MRRGLCIGKDELLMTDSHMKGESLIGRSSRPMVRTLSLLLPDEGPILMWKCSWADILWDWRNITLGTTATAKGQEEIFS